MPLYKPRTGPFALSLPLLPRTKTNRPDGLHPPECHPNPQVSHPARNAAARFRRSQFPKPVKARSGLAPIEYRQSLLAGLCVRKIMGLLLTRHRVWQPQMRAGTLGPAGPAFPGGESTAPILRVEKTIFNRLCLLRSNLMLAIVRRLIPRKDLP